MKSHIENTALILVKRLLSVDDLARTFPEAD